MKKLLFFLFIFIIPYLSFSQHEQYVNGYTGASIIDENYVLQQDWTVEKENYLNSFFWSVLRTKDEIDGYYWYYVHFYSNSYIKNGKFHKALTYISNVKITMYQDFDKILENSPIKFDIPSEVNFEISHIICDHNIEKYEAWFKSPLSTNTFNISYEKITAYDFSKQ